jgi:hypothetical protein
MGECVLAAGGDAVGTALAGGPPHRSVREELPHTAPTSGRTRRRPVACRTPSRTSDTHVPALCPGRGRLVGVSLGRSPSLHGLRSLCGFVRPLLRYYGTVRLPKDVHVGRTAFSLRRPAPAYNTRGRLWGLPASAHGVSTHAMGLRLRGVGQQLAHDAVDHVAFPLLGQGRHTGWVISELNTTAYVAPCQRLAHDLTVTSA